MYRQPTVSLNHVTTNISYFQLVTFSSEPTVHLPASLCNLNTFLKLNFSGTKTYARGPKGVGESTVTLYKGAHTAGTPQAGSSYLSDCTGPKNELTVFLTQMITFPLEETTNKQTDQELHK